MEYYQSYHVPLVFDRCGGAIKRGEIERGIAGLEPGSNPPYCVAAHMLFESTEAMEATFGANVQEFAADIPNFTNIYPTVQISEVLG
jgi:uncharacterized protein (TIGR02118 family)